MSNALNPNLPKEVRSFPFSPVRNSPFPPRNLGWNTRQRVEGVISSTDRLIRGHLAIWLNAMLQTEELPAPGKSKRTNRWFRGWWSDFGHRCGSMILGVVFEFRETPTCGVKFSQASNTLSKQSLWRRNRWRHQTVSWFQQSLALPIWTPPWP